MAISKINPYVKSCGFTLVELLVVMGVIAVLMGLALPAIQSVRSSADRTDCNNRLRQIAIATMTFEAAKRSFPPGINSYFDETRPSSSWLAHILPFCDQDNLSKQSASEFMAGLHPTSSPHASLHNWVDLFNCPSDPRPSEPRFTHGNRLVALTSYVGVCGTNFRSHDGVLYLDSSTRIAEIVDGTSNTLLVGERPPSNDDWYGWWYAGYGQEGSGSPDMLLGSREINVSATYLESCSPGPYEFADGNLDDDCHVFHYWSFHLGGAHFAFADGSIRFISTAVDSTLIPALATRAGRELATFDD